MSVSAAAAGELVSETRGLAAEARQTSSEAATTILRVEGLVKHFPIKAGLMKHTVGQVRAVDGVDLTVRRGRDAWPRR